jgi:RNA polymerase primary sigma factor
MAQSKKKKSQTDEQLSESESLAKSASNDSGESVNISEEAIKTLIKTGRERGFVTHDELNKALPQGELTSEQIEDVMAELNSMGVNVVDNADQEDVVEDSDDSEGTSNTPAGNISDESRGSDDPVRMYLREMGTVELLTREGEIAIAKRIEAGRELMLGGVYESPLTIRALIQWRDEIEQGLVLMRDVIDLETTFTRINGEDSAAIAIATDDDDSILINSTGLNIKTESNEDERRRRR